MKKMAWILLVLVVLVPAAVGIYSGWLERGKGGIESDPVCQKQAMGFSICEIAKAQVENLSKHLPYQVDAKSTITAVAAERNTMRLTVVTTFSQATFEEEIAAHLPEGIKSFTDSQTALATESVCHSDKVNQAFINAGGVIEYHMQYQDTRPLTTYRVEHCPGQG